MKLMMMCPKLDATRQHGSKRTRDRGARGVRDPEGRPEWSRGLVREWSGEDIQEYPR